MKPAITAFVALVALSAGTVAGFFGQEILNPKTDDSPLISKKHIDEAPVHDDSALKKEISDLQSNLDGMKIRHGREIKELNKQIGDLKDKNSGLNTKLEEKSNAESVGSSTTESVEVAKLPAAGTPEYDEAVKKAAEDIASKESEERQARRTKMMQDFMKRGADAVIANLTEKLSLDTVQQENITKILASASEKRSEVATRGRAAMSAGEEFDWGTEMSKVSDDAAKEIRGELGTSQLSTFNDLMDKDEIDLTGRSAMGRGMGRRSRSNSDN